jgi:hypothetical protein
VSTEREIGAKYEDSAKSLFIFISLVPRGGTYFFSLMLGVFNGAQAFLPKVAVSKSTQADRRETMNALKHLKNK